MKKIISFISLLVIALPACNLPATQSPGLSPNQQAATIVSSTLTAIAAGNVLLPSPTSGSTKPPLASPTGQTPTTQPTITPTAGTSTPTNPTLTVEANTNCREGPGQTDKVVIILIPGTTYQISARAADNKYWIVTVPNSTALCWASAEFSKTSGNVTSLPPVTPSAPTTPVGSAQAPAWLKWNYDCVYNGISGNIQVSLEWIDRSNNETGFRVYRDNVQVVELPTNTTTYTDLFTGSTTVPYSYRVSAFNAAGETQGEPITFSCQ